MGQPITVATRVENGDLAAGRDFCHAPKLTNKMSLVKDNVQQWRKVVHNFVSFLLYRRENYDEVRPALCVVGGGGGRGVRSCVYVCVSVTDAYLSACDSEIRIFQYLEKMWKTVLSPL